MAQIEQKIVFTDNTDEVSARVVANLSEIGHAEEQLRRAQSAGIKGLEQLWANNIEKLKQKQRAEEEAIEIIAKQTEEQKKLENQLNKSDSFFGRLTQRLNTFKNSLKGSNVKQFSDSLDSGTKSSKGFAGALDIVFTVFKRLAIITAVVDILLKFSDVGEKVEKVLDSISVGLSVVFNNGKKLTSIFTNIVTLNFGQVKNEFNGLVNTISNAVSETLRLKQVFKDLNEFDTVFSVVTAQVKSDIEALRLEADNTNNSYSKRNSLLVKATSLEQGVIKQLKEQEQNRRQALLDSFAIAQSDEEKLALSQQIADNQIKIIGLNSDEIKAKAELREKQKTIAKEAKEEADKRKKELEDLQNRIRKQTREASAKGESDPQEELKQLRDSALEETRILEKDINERLNTIKASEQRRLEFSNDFKALRLAIEKKYQDDLSDLLEKEEKKQFDNLEKLGEQELNRLKEKQANLIKNIKEEEELQIKRVDSLNNIFDKELTDEQVKEARRLQIKIKSLENQKQVLEDFGKGDTREAKLLDVDIELLQNELNKVVNLDVSPLDRLKQRILSTFKISDEEFSFITEQLGGALGNIFDSFSANTDRLLAENDRLIQSIDSRIEIINDKLKEELDKKQNGYANDVVLLEEQLTEQNRLRQEAENQRLLIEKRAANQRLFQESVQQASSIVTAVTGLIASQASKGLIGLIAGISGVALIFATISKARSNAAQFSNSAPKLRSGMKLKGRTHEEGGEPLVVGDRYYEAEANEWLIGTEHSKEHDLFLNNLNSGRYKGLNLPNLVEKGKNFLGNFIPIRFGLSDMSLESLKFVNTSINMIEKLDTVSNEIILLRKQVKDKSSIVAMNDSLYKVEEKGNTMSIVKLNI